MQCYIPDTMFTDADYLGHTFSRLEAAIDLQYLKQQEIELSVRKLALRWRWSYPTAFRFIKENETLVKQKRNKSTTENQGVTQNSETLVKQKRNKIIHSAEKETLSPNNNIIITPIKEKEIKKEKVKKEIDFSIVADNMRPVVDIWLSYKKEKQQSYKPIGFRTFYKRLCELSGNNPNIAMQIVEQSMTNNYSGIFPLKQENYANNRTTGNNNGQQFANAQERENWLISRLSRKYKGVLDE